MVQHQSLTERLPEPVLVLGGGGFIGSNLIRELTELGYDTYAVDVEFHDWRFTPDAEHTVLCDLRSDYATDNLFARGWGTVFHLAADMGGVEYFHSDKDFGAAIDNQLITTNVLKYAVKHGVQRLIYASSACAADTSSQMISGVPHAIEEYEITYGDPDARYGAEKRHGAWMVANAPIDTRVSVFHTVYGPGQEYVGNRRKFPSAVCTNAMASRETGELILFGDGKQIRTYLYVDDAVDRLIQLASIPQETLNVSGHWLDRVFNIGSTEEVTCEEIARMCLDLVGSSAKITYDNAKPSGVLARSCNPDKWRATFGTPRETPVREGFTNFIVWLGNV